MKRLLTAAVAALAGALAGSAAKQFTVAQPKPEVQGTEMVIATTPTPVIAGAVAGLLVRRPGRRMLFAFLVAAGVAANLDVLTGKKIAPEPEPPAEG